MLAENIPLREHSHLDLQRPDSLALEDRLCPGCKNSVVNEQGGLVVAFGQSFFHVDCFKCAKCRNQVTADTNLLLLSDGSPICANCSYSCNICHLPILDEAIMTGDDSYHAHCFKCKVCSNRIDELVFAKTSQGIYCMNCHNERMIKIRKHAQKKAEREKANGGSGSSRTRDHEAKNAHRDQERSDEPSRSSSSRSQSAAPSSRIDNSRPSETFRSPAKPIQGPYVSDAFEAKPPPSYSHSLSTQSQANGSTTTLSPQPRPPSLSQSPSFTVAPPDETTRPPSHPSTAHLDAPHKSNTLPIPLASSSSDFKRRSSYDDGVRPLNVLLKQDSLPPEKSGLQLPSEGLSVTSRRDKRRSINPGLSLSPFKDAVPTQLSPRQTSFQPEQTPYLNGHDQSYRAISPKQPSRPSSRSSSVHSSLSSHPDLDQYYRPRSPSIRSTYNPDDTIIMTSPPTMTIELENSQETPRSHGQTSNDPGLYNGPRTSGALSPVDANGFHSQRRISSASLDRHHVGSRSASPSYRADVPQNVESGTDTDPENETDSTSSHNQDAFPPAPPPKDVKDPLRVPNLNLPDGSIDLDSPEISQLGDISEDMGESVERMSHTTYIAPALPPIRFSMDTADFAELLGNVGGAPSLKHLDNLAKLTKQGKTPPSSEATQQTSKNGQGASLNGVRGDNDIRHSNASTLSGVPEERGSSDEHDVASDTPLSDNSRPATATMKESSTTTNARRLDPDPDLVISKLREALNNAKEKGAQQIKVDIGFVDAIVEHLASRNAEYYRLKNRVDGMNRESKLFIDGMTVAQVEYDRELKARRDAEAEVTRLRVLLSGQAVRLTALSGDSRRQELRQQLSKELNDNLSGLEQDLSRLKVERDVTLAEMEELSAKRSVGSPTDIVPTNLGRSLTKRLETIRNQYQRELVPLTEQKESLTREIAELKAVRDVFLEETTVLNARNEELAQLSAVYARRIENAPETPVKSPEPSQPQQPQTSFDTPRPQLLAPSLSSSTSGSSTAHDETQDSRYMRAPRSEMDLHTPAKPKFKWPGSKPKELVSPSPSMETSKGKAHIEHNFQQLSVLRFTRCDHCGDKMWGSQLRCTVCSTSIHVRCIVNVQIPCSQHNGSRDDVQAPLPPSMFGRTLTEQVQADSKGEDRQVPVIVEKCIEAVEARALDYEGIYRKTGGSGQSKAITQMFERGDYESFDLCDSDRFNDICSVTSVLKTYFRSLPVPLLTFDLHDQFMAAIAIRDQSVKHQSLVDLVDKLPNEHYFTLRLLMLHLNRVCERSEKNLMNGRNLGVVFGPTLLRSRDPGAEFSDMAGKALFVEWLVENAPAVFNFSE